MRRTMSLVLWNKLPNGFLNMKFKRWATLDHDVRLLIVELASEQKFKCALCSQTRALVVEHDHDPEYGPGKPITIHNIRWLACQRCNWHLMVYEKDRNGEHRGFDEAYSYVSDHEWESYIYAYECRVGALREARLEKELGSLNYWRRRNFLSRFDGWQEWGGRYPWHWGFDEIKDQKYGKIRTPLQFIKSLAACVQFVKGELEKNPEYEPPEKFLEVIFRIKPLMDELRPIVGARLLELGKSNNAAVGASA
jgi:hypothetical protein